MRAKKGFRFDCFGNDANPHRVTVYLSEISSSTRLPSKESSARVPEATEAESRAARLLRRVSAFDGKAVVDGKGKDSLVGSQTGR